MRDLPRVSRDSHGTARDRDTFGFPPVVDAIVAAAGGLKGRPLLITGRNTFSDASLFTASVTSRTPVTVVGEPMGGSPNLFGNARDFTLPFSGLGVTVATGYFQPVDGDLRVELLPDR